MSRPPRGIYDTLVTEELRKALDLLDQDVRAKVEELRPTDAGDRIALHLSGLIRRAVDATREKDRSALAIQLAQQILAVISAAAPEAVALSERPLGSENVLHAIARLLPDGTPEAIVEPLIPLLDTTLLTNGTGDPNVGSQLLAEIQSADRIDMLVAFIRYSGIRPLRDALRRHCDAGRELRVLTTTYTGSTEHSALELLQDLGARIRVSYDTSGTRLHAKAWLFHRFSGFSTAYVGSSNLTHSAQVSGLEWNVRVSGVRNPDVINKIEAVFATYWQGGDFTPYDAGEFRARTRAPGGPTLLLPPTELRAESFQEHLLEQIAVARQQGHHRNLLVAATGTGKTVMAALDYARLRRQLPRHRLLFVAHREELLTQALQTFRHALRDASFGELWVGGEHPAGFEHVFASIQSLNASGLSHLAPDHFDVLIVDEFHHAAAASYRRLLEHARPRELLGLTATPERSDGLPILHWFDDRIAAELRLRDAIDQQRLVPFLYYGIYDDLDLREVPWKRGKGYDVQALSNLVTGNDILARRVIQQLEQHVGDLSAIRALGFCVSIEHARFMAHAFSAAGIPAAAVTADSSDAERRTALEDLRSRRIRVLFSVDLFNEGVDLPMVDTLLMLRPTESPTVFIQQLGRGLRKSPDKGACTVLDFVGNHRREFRYDLRLSALLGGTRQEIARQIQTGFPFLPAGCHFDLDKVAKDIVLRSLENAVPSRWSDLVAALAAAAGAEDCSLLKYLKSSDVDLGDIYSTGRSWSDLRSAAKLPVEPPGGHEVELRRAIGRMLHVNDMSRIDGYRRFLASPAPPQPGALPERERRLLRMLVVSLIDSRAIPGNAILDEGIQLVWDHPQVLAELRELLEVLASRIAHLPLPLDAPADVPLEIHARYTRNEILAAFGAGTGARVPNWMRGVRWVPETQVDLLPFTLDNTDGEFSPRTRYRNYAIDRHLIHWESPATTRADGETGRRYQGHVSQGTRVMLFARERRKDRSYHFLGTATYVQHESELPMVITWRLTHPLPADLFSALAVAVA